MRCHGRTTTRVVQKVLPVYIQKPCKTTKCTYKRSCSFVSVLAWVIQNFLFKYWISSLYQPFKTTMRTKNVAGDVFMLLHKRIHRRFTAVNDDRAIDVWIIMDGCIIEFNPDRKIVRDTWVQKGLVANDIHCSFLQNFKSQTWPIMFRKIRNGLDDCVRVWLIISIISFPDKNNNKSMLNCLRKRVTKAQRNSYYYRYDECSSRADGCIEK